MIYYTCDCCGCELPRGSLRYVAKIDLFAAYDTLEITREDLEKDLEAEMKKILAVMRERDADDLMKEVYAGFRFDLCPRCQARYVRDPLAGMRAAAPEAGRNTGAGKDD